MTNNQKAPLHDLTKKQIYKYAVRLRDQGKLFNLPNAYYEDTFKTSIDSYCEIAYHLRKSKRVLDIGAGSGLLLSLLHELGHDCYAIDITDLPNVYANEIFAGQKIHFKLCNVEIDNIPYADNYFDAVVCSETLEHFTHSHLNAIKEMYRVLDRGGIIEINVPNAVCFRNRSRMLRGKHITWDYEKHYLDATPVIYKGIPCYPDRHNREFTADELRLLLERGDFKNIHVYFLKSRRHREGLQRLRSIGSAVRDIVPSLRKSLIGFGEKL